MKDLTMKAILTELHKTDDSDERLGWNVMKGDGLLYRLGYDIPTDFHEQLEELTHDELKNYYDSVIEFIDEHIFNQTHF
mgnify:CR=1 FL=1